MTKLLSSSDWTLGSEHATRAWENGSSLEQAQLMIGCDARASVYGFSLESGPFLRGDSAMEAAKKGFLRLGVAPCAVLGLPGTIGSCFLLRLQELPSHHPMPSRSDPR